MGNLRSLDWRLQPWAEWIYSVGKYNDPRLVVTSAYRSDVDQRRLYDKWLSGASSIPAAPPGKSLHNFRLAFDMARIGIDPLSDELLMWLGAVWESVGGKHGGARDPVHFQAPV